jgi:hypothetical protein
LLAGQPALPGLRTHDELDALVTAFLAGTNPDAVTLLGDQGEGQIVVPVARSDLKPMYGPGGGKT